jgi:signal peptide peptidase SppA
MLHLLAAFYRTPWALEPGVFASVEHILLRWAAGTRLGADDISAAIGDAPEAAAQRRSAAMAASGRGVAVVPVYGVLAHRAYAVANTSRPLTSTEALAAQMRAAAADPEVGTIIMDVDSPGGSVFGVQELGDVLADIRNNSGKHLVAVANNMAASGGYWLASQAHELVVTPSGMVGSIGVIVPHQDTSAMRERVGVKTEYITAGKYKAEGYESGPLTDEHRAHLQSQVDAYYAAFTKAVAQGRNLPVGTVRGEAFGEGRMRLAADAKSNGMADRVATLEDTIARYARSAAPRGGLRAELADRDIQILEA